jgi:hypothetical protein
MYMSVDQSRTHPPRTLVKFFAEELSTAEHKFKHLKLHFRGSIWLTVAPKSVSKFQK